MMHVHIANGFARRAICFVHAITPQKDPTSAILSASRASLRDAAREEIAGDRIAPHADAQEGRAWGWGGIGEKRWRVASISLKKTAPSAAGQLALPTSCA